MKSHFLSLSLFILLILLVPVLLQGQGSEKLTYKQTTLAVLAAGKEEMTRAQLTGNVTYVSKEGDGDIHIRVCDSPNVKNMDKNHCIVAEIMPCDQSKIASPKVGQKIKVGGITRFDAEHKWWELHPVSFIK